MDDTLLLRYLLKCCSLSDINKLEDWLAADNEHAAFLFDMENLWRLKDELRFSDRQRVGQAYQKFLSNIDEKRQLKESGKRNRFSIISFVKYAAVSAIFILLSFNLYYLFKADGKEEFSLVNIIEVPQGQRASLTLHDGTKVWLNSKSKLEYPVDF